MGKIFIIGVTNHYFTAETLLDTLERKFANHDFPQVRACVKRALAIRDAIVAKSGSVKIVQVFREDISNKDAKIEDYYFELDEIDADIAVECILRYGAGNEFRWYGPA